MDYGDMGHGSEEVPGMMYEAQMEGLRNADGATFDQIPHDDRTPRRAIEIARDEQAEGKNDDAVGPRQEAEITKMNELLGS